MFDIPFKVFGWIVKATLFAAAILILGNVLHIGGKTVSDQVRTSLSHAEQLAPTNTMEHVKSWTNDLADRTKRAADELKKPARHVANETPVSQSTPIARSKKPPLHGKITQNNKKVTPDASGTENILASERQELRTLIRELNTSTEKLTAN